MKSLNALLVFAGILVTTIFFSFTSDEPEPKKEYAYIYYKGFTLITNYPDDTETTESINTGNAQRKLNATINNLAKEGWTPFLATGSNVHLYRIKK